MGSVLVPLAAAAIGARQGPGRLRARLKTDAEILEKLPDKSEAREVMLAFVAAESQQLSDFELVRRRDPVGLAVGIVGTIAVGLTTVWLAGMDSGWATAGAVVMGLLTAFFTIGIFISARRVVRDDKGKQVKASPSPD